MYNSAMRLVIALFFMITLISPALGASMMERWNDYTHGFQIPWDPKLGPGNTTFRWEEIIYFPHPTFKGGSEQAYESFGLILIGFLSNEFSYLQNNNLFTYTLIYQFPSGEVALSTTFKDLSAELSESTLVSEYVRSQLKILHQRIIEATEQ